MTHRNAVGDGDRGKHARRTARRGDAAFHNFRLRVQRDVARRGFVPAGRNADQWLGDVFVRPPERAEMAQNQWAPSGAGFARPSTLQVSLKWVVQTSLCLSFLMAFLEYEFASPLLVFLPLMILAF